MDSRDAERVYGDPNLVWRVLGLLNVFRLLVPSVLSTVAALSPAPRFLGSTWPTLFSTTLAGMFVAGVLCIGMLKRRWPDLRVQAYIHIGFDIIAIASLMLASGGTDSGLGLLLVVPVGAISLLVANRSAILIASLAALAILGQQTALVLLDLAESTAFTQTGLLGAVIFIVALAAAPLSNRIRESEALVRQKDVDLANLAQLSQYVVERLRESIVVVDEQDRIRLINESARQILNPGNGAAGALLGEVSPRLLYLLETWRQNPRTDEETAGTLVAADGSREVRPHFAQLGNRWPCPVIVFLEDLSAQSARVQQNKLAALGRLSASIAHEIRNPVGAMSHAAQLLSESAGLSGPDQRLAEIIQGNAARVSAIIQNVMQLSRREEIQAERMPLAEWLEEFAAEYRTHTRAATRALTRRAPRGGDRSPGRSLASAPDPVEPGRECNQVWCDGNRFQDRVAQWSPARQRATLPGSGRSRTRDRFGRRRTDLRAILHLGVRRHRARPVHLAGARTKQWRPARIRAACRGW